MPLEESRGIQFPMVEEEGAMMQAPKTNLAKSRWQVSKIVPFLLTLVLLTACNEGTKQDIQRLISGFLTEQAAIEKAINYCQTLGTPQETPHNFIAEFSTCQDVKDRLPHACDQRPPDLKVWFVTMDGIWLHSPLPPASGSPVPIPFNRCQVLMNAQTGERLQLLAGFYHE